jgi:putative peptidoglycan lipid II flippase
VLIAGFVQLLVQVPALVRLGLLPRPRWGWRHSGVRRVLKLMVPTLIGSSVAQVNLLLDLVIATFLVSGSVSWLYYSDRLMEFPLGVFGVALSTVILPNLSRKFAGRNPQAFSHTLDWALRLAAIITLPAALGLAALSKPILVTLFQYDAFEVSDVNMSAMSLVAYAAGLPAFIAVKVLAPGFYARQDTKTPVKIAIASMVSNMGMNLLFVGVLVAVGFSGPHTGLALASSAAAYVNAGLLYGVLRKQGVYSPEPGWGRVWLAVMLACVAMGAALAWQYGDLQGWVAAPAAKRATHLFLLISFGALVYGATLLLGGLRPAHVSKGSS